MNNSQISAAITEKIIANLETAGSWMKLWQVPSPVSINGHYYRGINRLVLSSDPFKSRVYGTFQQIRSNGGQVRKGEKSIIVVFWKNTVDQDEATGEKKKMFLLRFYHVFNSEQAEFDEQGKQKIAQLQSLVDKKVNTEHLEAELCSFFLAGIANIEMDIRNSAAYIRGWASALRDNQKWVMWAATRAEKSADYILGNVPSIPAEEKTTAIVISEVPVLDPVTEDLPF
ncbi:MAG: ArdC-like ssDNA-binding domain-containing protein [Bacteroidetes bacterium]|nr:ArdC-like ssDNA-binding domain-containing protein [Bacteroidota bacterium]